MRYTLRGLTPATTYAIQVRVVRPERKSEWSRRFIVTTINNSTKPDVPGNVIWVSVGDGFYGEWDSVGTNESGQQTKIDRYEVRLVANGIPKIVSVPQTTGSRVSFNLPYQQILSLWATPMFEIAMQVRSVDAWDRKSDWSPLITASNPPPGPLTNFQARAIRDGVELSWEPPTDTDLSGFRVYVGTSADFTPHPDNKIYYGTGTRITYATSTYTELFFKACALDKFLQEGPFSLASATPLSPFGVDTDAPDVPSSVTATIENNESNTVATATVSWELAETPMDLAGFHIRYREVGTTAWYQESVDASTTSVTIIMPEVFKDYEFQVTAFDFMANYSGWSTSVIATAGTNLPPSTVPSVNMTAGLDSVQISWPAVSDPDVIGGVGTYEINVAEDAGFSVSMLTYNTGSTSISINGLDLETTYYVRVRAVDSGGLTGGWSPTAQATTGTFPEINQSDGLVPGTSPSAVVVPKIGSLYVRWAPVTTNSNGDPQEDLVKYEVHVSITDNFTPNSGTKVSETYGLSYTLETTSGGTPLDYDTVYYVKIIAKDFDGAAPVGMQGSGSPLRATGADVDITPGDIGAVSLDDLTEIVGATKVTWSTEPPGSTTNAAGDIWFMRNATTGLVTGQWEGLGGTSWAARTLDNAVIANLTAGKITSGVIGAQVIEVSSSGSIRSTDYDGTHGWSLSTDGLVIREGMVYANTLVGGTGILNNLVLSASGAVQSENFDADNGFRLSSTGLIIRGTNNIVSAETLKGGTVNGTQINIGVGGSLVVDQTGEIRSNNYFANSSGYKLSSSGLEVNDGLISASALKSGTAIVGVLTMGVSSGAPGEIKSANYQAGVSGYRLSSNGLELNTGTIYAGAIALQAGENLVPAAYADFEAQPSFYTGSGLVRSGGASSVGITYSARTNQQALSVSWSSVSSNPQIWLGASQSDYNIAVEAGKSYIVSGYVWNTGGATVTVFLRVKWNNGTISTVNSGVISGGTTASSATRINGVVTVPSGVTACEVLVETNTLTGGSFVIDAIQMETKLTTVTTPSSWRPPGGTRIDGSIIRTGEIRSNFNGYVWSGSSWVPSSQPMWSINMNGAASFADVQVQGRMVVGGAVGGASAIQSGNYVPGPSGSGWHIDSTGSSTFMNMKAYGTGNLGFLQGLTIRTNDPSLARVEINSSVITNNDSSVVGRVSSSFGGLSVANGNVAFHANDGSGWGPWGLFSSLVTPISGGSTASMSILGPRLSSESWGPNAAAAIVMKRNTADPSLASSLELYSRRLTMNANKFFIGSLNDTSIDFNLSSSTNTFQFKSVTGPAMALNLEWGTGDVVLQATNASGSRKRLLLTGQGIEFNTNGGTRNIVARYATDFPDSPTIGDVTANAFIGFRNQTNQVHFTSMSGSGYVNLRANAFNTTSDRERKKEIAVVESGVLDKIKAVDVYSYKMNYDEEPPTEEARPQSDVVVEQKYYGLMADEVIAQFPEVVMVDEDPNSESGTSMSINIYGLLSIAVKSIQELTDLVGQQSTRIAELERKSKDQGNRP